MLSTDDLDHMVTFMWIQIFYFLSVCNWLSVTKAKLTMIIHAPCINLIGIVEVEWMIPSTEYVFGILSACFFNFERLFLFVSRFQFTTNFAWLRISPCIHFLALGQSNCMLCSAHDFLNPGLRLRAENLGCDTRGRLNFTSRLSAYHVLYTNDVK